MLCEQASKLTDRNNDITRFFILLGSVLIYSASASSAAGAASSAIGAVSSAIGADSSVIGAASSTAGTASSAIGAASSTGASSTGACEQPTIKPTVSIVVIKFFILFSFLQKVISL
jgi:hypothetical protein